MTVENEDVDETEMVDEGMEGLRVERWNWVFLKEKKLRGWVFFIFLFLNKFLKASTQQKNIQKETKPHATSWVTLKEKKILFWTFLYILIFYFYDRHSNLNSCWTYNVQ